MIAIPNMRDCENCIRNLPGQGCTSWDCEYEPIKGDLISRRELIDRIEGATWYHVEDGKLMIGANGETDTPLYRADVIYDIIENMPGVEKKTGTEEHSSKLKIAKDIIKKNFKDGNCGLFNTNNYAGDLMSNLYDDNGLHVDICYPWAYFEVFGLTEEEFIDLKAFYRQLEKIAEEEK